MRAFRQGVRHALFVGWHGQLVCPCFLHWLTSSQCHPTRHSKRVALLVTLRAALLLGAWLAAAQPALALSSRPETGTFAPPAAKSPAARPSAKNSSDPFWAAVDRFAGRLSPLEERLFAAAADGRLAQHDLLSAALVASGVEDVETLRRYQQRVAALVDELRHTGRLTGSPRRQAEVIFEFMHRRILYAGYRIECTDLRLALDHGWFNCISASVLLNCLAGEFGLSVCGLETPGHAMSRIFLPDGPLDVETTCPRWFHLSGDPQKQAEHVATTIGRSPAKDRSLLRAVSEVELAAMIYYNRGVDLLAEKRYAAAAAANAKALRLDPTSTTARGNLLATINNWAIALGSARQFVEAADLLRQGMAMDPAFETFQLNYVHVHYQWTQHLCESGRFEEALGLLARAAAECPNRPYFREAPLEVYRRWARSLATVGGGT